MYDGDKSAQNALIDKHLAKYPNSYVALADKGVLAVNDRNYKEAIEWLRKAATVNPDNAAIFTYIGVCFSSLASNCEDESITKDYYKQAIDAFDKAKELDPDNNTRWGYNRYQVYYGLYGEDDPRTKAAEADK